MKRVVISVSTGGQNSKNKRSMVFDINNTSPNGDGAIVTMLNAATDAVQDMLIETSYVTQALCTPVEFVDGAWRKSGGSYTLKMSKQGSIAADDVGASDGTEVPDYVRLLINKTAALNPAGRLYFPGALFQHDLVPTGGGQYNLLDSRKTALQALATALKNSFGYDVVLLNPKDGGYRVVQGFSVAGIANRQTTKSRRTTKSKELAAALAESRPLIRLIEAEHTAEGSDFAGINSLSSAARLAVEDLKGIILKYGPVIGAEILRRIPDWLTELLAP